MYSNGKRNFNFLFFITVYDRFNGRKSLNPKEFLFAGAILLVLTTINIFYYKNKNIKNEIIVEKKK